MSSGSQYGGTNDKRRRRVGAGLGVVAAGAIGAALFSAAVAPAAKADTPEPDIFQDFFGSNAYTIHLDNLFDAGNPVVANYLGAFMDAMSPPNVGPPVISPGDEPDPFEDLAGTNGGVPFEWDNVLVNFAPKVAQMLDAYIDANPPDNDALADLTQAFGATGAAFIAGFEQAITGMPITDAMADMAIASAGLGPF